MRRTKKEDWNTAQGILDGIHRIREELERERQRMGTTAWLKKVNSASKRLGLYKRHKAATSNS